jgi:cytochrome c-type biogenesis protein CcmH
MPVAVMRKAAGELPFEFELDDSMALSPDAKLSGFRNVIIGARISRSGDAIAKKGDLEGYSDIIEVGNTDVRVNIALSVIE